MIMGIMGFSLLSVSWPLDLSTGPGRKIYPITVPNANPFASPTRHLLIIKKWSDFRRSDGVSLHPATTARARDATRPSKISSDQDSTSRTSRPKLIYEEPDINACRRISSYASRKSRASGSCFASTAVTTSAARQ